MSGSNSSVPAATPAEPGEDLSLTVHALQPALVDAPARSRGRLVMLLILLACAAPVVASYFTYYVWKPEGRSNYGRLIQPSLSLPPPEQLALRGEDGQSVNPQSLRGQWLLVVVAPGSCDSQCEHLLYAQRQLRETLGKEKDRVDRVWLVEGDSPIRAELRGAMAGATVLHGSREQIAAWLQPQEGHALEQHLYLVDPMGEWMMRFPPRFDPPRVKKDLERLLRASTSWDLPGR
ncbi:MAG: hypothetical protein RL722_795 [Pseudomonadota bacterium]|jgi:hypothetical protein